MQKTLKRQLGILLIQSNDYNKKKVKKPIYVGENGNYIKKELKNIEESDVSSDVKKNFYFSLINRVKKIFLLFRR